MTLARWPHGDPNVVAKAVLAQAAYRQPAASTAQKPAPSLWEQAWNWFVDHVLVPIFRPIAHALSHSQSIGQWVGLVLIAFALCGLAFLIFRLVLAFVRPRADGGEARDGVRTLDEQRSWREWLALARAAAARGDYAGAIAALFGASLAALDERAVVVYDPARTPGEYRRLVRRSRADASPSFDDLTDRFVRAAYGPGAVAQADFEAAERAFSNFEPLVAR